jgi:hypothetical protein
MISIDLAYPAGIVAGRIASNEVTATSHSLSQNEQRSAKIISSNQKINKRTPQIK